MGRVQLAGVFVAIERRGRRRDGPVTVKDLLTGRVAYRADVSYADHFSLGADGTLATTIFFDGCCSLTGRLGWYSPRSPRLHRLPNRVAIFSGPTLVSAAGRIAYVSRYDGAADDGLRSICVGDRILVQARASVIEVQPVTAPRRLPTASLPLAAPYHSPAHERPECSNRD